MTNEIIVNSPHKDFESIKKIDENGVEYWTARELVPILGYSKWQHFEEVIEKAKKACINSRQFPQDHFTDVGKMTKVGYGIVRKLDDYKLDRYACYLIAQNGDSRKSQIAIAQTYFAIQTRRQEIQNSLPESERRIAIHEEVHKENRGLLNAAKSAGVSRFGAFNDAGYQGLYSMPLEGVENKKHIPKGELLNHASSEEIAANLFRITQTEAKLKRENVKGDIEAQNVHFDIGKKVRNAIKDMGGNMPEDLPPEKHIRIVKKEVKALKKGMRKLTLK